MRPLGDVASHVLAESQRAAESRAARVREALGNQDMHEHLAREHGDAFAALVPRETSLGQYLGGTSDYIVDAAKERLRFCARCDGAPARCAGRTDQLLEIGLRPAWTDAGLAADPCDVYAKHTTRERLRIAGVPKAMLDCGFDTFEPVSELQRRALSASLGYVESFGTTDPKRSGLLLIGEGFGIGKTHLAISVLRTLVERGASRRPYMLYVPEFLDAIRRSFDEPTNSPNRSLIRKATRADLLVLDDLGAERTTEWVQEQLLIILNARWSSGFATVVTTNARAKEIRQTLGERAYSRLWGCMGRRIMLQGEDRRKNG